MKIHLMTDLEGVAGVYQWENREEDTSLENHERCCRQCRWLAEEVNAAVEGFFAGGASEVIVNDGHGAGYTIDMDILDSRVQVISGRERPAWLPFLDASCDATGIVGAHAKAATEGACLAHTMNPGIRDWQFNGISMGEMGIQAATGGLYDVPFVFCAGDAWACLEMEELIPGIITAPVKYGTSCLSAVHCSRQEACRRIREAAEKAMEVTGEVEPVKLKSPVHFRDERVEPSFDPENPDEGWEVISAHVRETEAEDIIALMGKRYRSFDPDWQPIEFTPAWQK